jgi:hypothetical protein
MSSQVTSTSSRQSTWQRFFMLSGRRAFWMSDLELTVSLDSQDNDALNFRFRE